MILCRPVLPRYEPTDEQAIGNVLAGILSLIAYDCHDQYSKALGGEDEAIGGWEKSAHCRNRWFLSEKTMA